MLEFDRVSVGYGDLTVIQDVSFRVGEGEVVSLVGSNGAGKTTLLRTIAGLLRPARGEIRLRGEPIHRTPPYEIVRRRVAMVPEGRQLFGRLSVWDNLLMGAYTLRSSADVEESLESVVSMFPILKERRAQRAETLSGGEQQQLAIARVLLARPKLLLMDEPTEGIQPSVIDQIEEVIERIRNQGISVLLVEQYLEFAWRLASSYAIMRKGTIVSTGATKELREDMVRQHLTV